MVKIIMKIKTNMENVQCDFSWEINLEKLKGTQKYKRVSYDCSFKINFL